MDTANGGDPEGFRSSPSYSFNDFCHLLNNIMEEKHDYDEKKNHPLKIQNTENIKNFPIQK